jgi:hypothetical protein
MSTQRVTEERIVDASAVLKAGQAIEIKDDYVLVPFQIVGVHARVRVSSKSSGPLVDASGATDVIPVGDVRVDIKLKKDDYIQGDPCILGEIIRQLQWRLKDGIEIKSLALQDSGTKLPANLTVS